MLKFKKKKSVMVDYLPSSPVAPISEWAVRPDKVAFDCPINNKNDNWYHPYHTAAKYVLQAKRKLHCNGSASPVTKEHWSNMSWTSHY